MSDRREELNRRNLLDLWRALTTYVEGGGIVHVETTHGDEANENRITLTVEDWDAFRVALEPGASIDES